MRQDGGNYVKSPVRGRVSLIRKATLSEDAVGIPWDKHLKRFILEYFKWSGSTRNSTGAQVLKISFISCFEIYQFACCLSLGKIKTVMVYWLSIASMLETMKDGKSKLVSKFTQVLMGQNSNANTLNGNLSLSLDQ